MENVLLEDFEDIASETCIDWTQLENAAILITGATGLIGSLLVKSLLYCSRRNHLDLKILAMIRDHRKAERIFGTDPGGEIVYVQGDINDPIAYAGTIDFIIHGAGITESKKMVACPTETFLTAVDGTKHILRLAVEKNVRSVVYISSMEVYGVTDSRKEKIYENDLGFIDHLSVRSSYSEGKRACELLCASYFAEYGVPVKIARLAQTFGAGVPDTDPRVFAQFARSAVNGNDIVLHTQGNSYGNYCYTADTIRGLLCLLTNGQNKEAYTLVNEETTMRIQDMARIVAEKIAGNKIRVVFDIPEDSLQYGYAPDVTTHLSAEKARGLGWTPRYGLEEMYRRMIESWWR